MATDPARIAYAFLLGVIAAPSVAQDATRWSVFVQENPTQCWVVAVPDSFVATRGEEDVTEGINRGEPMFFVSFWPEDGRLGEVSYTGGYPLQDGSTVSVEVGADSFSLFTEGPMSWAGSPQDDARIISAFRSGSEALVTATSSRGTQVADTFSLQGFTAAIEDAEARCSS